MNISGVNQAFSVLRMPNRIQSKKTSFQGLGDIFIRRKSANPVKGFELLEEETGILQIMAQQDDSDPSSSWNGYRIFPNGRFDHFHRGLCLDFRIEGSSQVKNIYKQAIA